jgi:predicted transcriptional regulator
MVELSNERIEQILHEETKKTEDMKTILRGIYLRYMNLFERYIADFDTLKNDKIDEFKKQHEETQSLIRYYYMDIPQDVCSAIGEFEKNSCENLLGRDWKKNLHDAYEEFKYKCMDSDMSEDYYRAEFKKTALDEFYKSMEEIFRSGFGTESESEKATYAGISGLLFGGKKSSDD